jgi:esterase FrsA
MFTTSTYDLKLEKESNMQFSRYYFPITASVFRIVVMITILTLLFVAAQEANEASPEDYPASDWYRQIRVAQWTWEGGDQAIIKAVLGKIAAADGDREDPRHLDTVTAYGPGNWTYEWRSAGEEAEQEARRWESDGNTDKARDAYIQAATYYNIASFPHTGRSEQREANLLALRAYENAGRYFTVSLERLEIPAGNDTVVAYLHLPKDKDLMPVVMKTGGQDVTKTEFYPLAKDFTDRGIAMISFDIPGTTNEAVLDPDAERFHAAVLDYLLNDPRFDPNRIAVWSESMGGLPAVKLAVTRQELRAVVNECGLLHTMLTTPLPADPALLPPDMQGLVEGMSFQVFVTRLGVDLSDFAAIGERSSALSLVNQGILTGDIRTDVPVLSVNTHFDMFAPTEDSVMAANASREGEMWFIGEEGHCPSRTETMPRVRQWLVDKLR